MFTCSTEGDYSTPIDAGPSARSVVSRWLLSHKSRASALASLLAVLVEESPTPPKALQHTGRDCQPALLRQPPSKPDHWTGRLSILIYRGMRVASVGRGSAGGTS